MKKHIKYINIFILTLIFIGINYEIAKAEPSFQISVGEADSPKQYVENIKLLIYLTILSLLPSILIMFTSFTRISITLSFLKNSLGIQQSIPNQVLIGLALFLTIFIMQPVYTQINSKALEPFSKGEIVKENALEAGIQPLKEFMLKETREKDLKLFVELSNTKEENLTKENISLTILAPAFIISELKTAFQMGFLIFIPFLVIDMVVSSVLMSMGMFMLPPATVALPFKILLFLLVDGWTLLVKSLVESFM